MKSSDLSKFKWIFLNIAHKLGLKCILSLAEVAIKSNVHILTSYFDKYVQLGHNSDRTR